MNLETIIKIKNNALLQRYIRENSYWYKILNRNPEFIYELERLMKDEYKLSLPDKIDKFKDKLDMLNTFIDILS